MNIKSCFLSILIALFVIKNITVYGQWYDQWSSPILVADNTDTPDFEIDPKTGKLHIVSMYTFTVDGGVEYTLMDSIGNILISERVPIVTGSYPNYTKDRGGWYYGATIAVDQNGYPHICYRVFENPDSYIFDLYYIRKTAAGWTNSIMISDNIWRGYVVRMAIDGQNRVHIIQSAIAEDINDKQPPEVPWGKVYYYQVQNGILITEKTKELHDPAWWSELEYRVDNRFEIDATGEAEVHLVLGLPYHTYTIPGRITYYHSTDGGNNFSRYGTVQSSQTPARNGDPDIFIDKTKSIHLVYGTHTDFDLNQESSIRYVRMINNQIIHHNIPHPSGALADWGKWGLGSVSASDDGQYVAVAYLRQSAGELWTTLSSEGGASWTPPVLQSLSCGGQEGRNKHLIRANRNHFYLIYPQNYGPNARMVFVRMLRNVGDNSPIASSGGPYSGSEGQSFQLDMSGSFDTGQNSGIVEYAWDWNQDGVFDDFSTPSPKINYTFADDYHKDAVLRIKDRIGNVDYDTTRFDINNVAPTVEIGEDKYCEEGDTILFTALIVDPGEDSFDVDWEFGDGSGSTDSETEHYYVDEGTYTAIVYVIDDDGGNDTDSLHVFVSNADPVVDAGGPYHGPVGAEIQLHGKAWDKGIYDILDYWWDLDADGVFDWHDTTATVSYSEMGVFKVYFRVTDNDGGSGLDSAMIGITSEAPLISGLANRTIYEGEAFDPINLDDYVFDLDHLAEQMIWTYSGNQDLLVSLENRIFQVAVPDSEWSGQETVRFIVSDPLGLKDTADVVFTVLAVNDPPRWLNFPGYIFGEDDTLLFTFEDLWERVLEVDDDSLDMTYGIFGNTYIHWFVDHQQNYLAIYPETNWFGQENIFITVTDTSGAADTTGVGLVVYSKPDPPDPFDLIDPLYQKFNEWPDSIMCVWQTALDPDTGSVVIYEWQLKIQGGTLVTSQVVSDDTSFCFFPDTSSLVFGTYVWLVKAYDEGFHSRESSNKGFLYYEDTTSTNVDWRNNTIPQTFVLEQNYPNPFNPETRIVFNLPIECRVRLTIYNQLGQLIRVIEDERQTPGIHTRIWDGRDQSGRKMPTGLYLYRLEADSKVFMRKMMLIQ